MPSYDYEGPPFRAWDEQGRQFTLVPRYRLKPATRGWERDRSPEYLVGLRTFRFEPVERDGRGRYRIAGPVTPLTSDDPNAV